MKRKHKQAMFGSLSTFLNEAWCVQINDAISRITASDPSFPPAPPLPSPLASTLPVSWSRLLARPGRGLRCVLQHSHGPCSILARGVLVRHIALQAGWIFGAPWTWNRIVAMALSGNVHVSHGSGLEAEEWLRDAFDRAHQADVRVLGVLWWTQKASYSYVFPPHALSAPTIPPAFAAASATLEGAWLIVDAARAPSHTEIQELVVQGIGPQQQQQHPPAQGNQAADPPARFLPGAAIHQHPDVCVRPNALYPEHWERTFHGRAPAELGAWVSEDWKRALVEKPLFAPGATSAVRLGGKSARQRGASARHAGNTLGLCPGVQLAARRVDSAIITLSSGVRRSLPVRYMLSQFRANAQTPGRARVGPFAVFWSVETWLLHVLLHPGPQRHWNALHQPEDILCTTIDVDAYYPPAAVPLNAAAAAARRARLTTEAAAALQTILTYYFQKTFPTTQWPRAHDWVFAAPYSHKLSLHLHNNAVLWRDNGVERRFFGELNAWLSQPASPLAAAAAAEPACVRDARAVFARLGIGAAPSSKSSQQLSGTQANAPLADTSVYSSLRSFKLAACCKPGKPLMNAVNTPPLQVQDRDVCNSNLMTAARHLLASFTVVTDLGGLQPPRVCGGQAQSKAPLRPSNPCVLVTRISTHHRPRASTLPPPQSVCKPTATNTNSPGFPVVPVRPCLPRVWKAMRLLLLRKLLDTLAQKSQPRQAIKELALTFARGFKTIVICDKQSTGQGTWKMPPGTPCAFQARFHQSSNNVMFGFVGWNAQRKRTELVARCFSPTCARKSLVVIAPALIAQQIEQLDGLKS